MARSGMFNDQQMELMIKEYQHLKSLKKVAIAFNVSVPTIAKYLRAAGVEIGKRGRPRKTLPLAVQDSSTFEEDCTSDRTSTTQLRTILG
jgi:hypothetical protein